MHSSTPFAGALALAVDVPIELIGKADNNIDDLIVISNAAAALALELVSRPPHVQKSIPMST
jgi:hypothetical protein